MAITNDKKILAVAGNPSVRLFDICTSQTINNNNNNNNAAANTTNKSAAATTVFEGHKGNVTAVGFQKDGRWIYTASEDGTIKIWDMRAPPTKYQRDYICGARVNGAALHPNQGELVSVDGNGSIRIWDLSGSGSHTSCVHELLPEEGVACQSVSLSMDGALMTVANNRGNCFVWRLPRADMDNLQPITKLSAHTTYITKCSLSPDSKRLATASADHTIKIWTTDTFALDKTLNGHSKWVWDVAWSADSAYLISASSDSTARLWDIENGEAVRQYTGHSKTITTVVLNDLPS